MIIRSKNQGLNLKYRGFFNSGNAAITKASISLYRKIELLLEYFSKEVGCRAKDFLYILSQLLHKNPTYEMTREWIANKIGCSTRTISRILVIIESAGYIRVMRYKTREGMNAPNIYSLTTYFWEVLEQLNFEKTLKPNNGGSDKVSKINITVPLPSKESLNREHLSVDNSPIFDDIPIPDF